MTLIERIISDDFFISTAKYPNTATCNKFQADIIFRPRRQWQMTLTHRIDRGSGWVPRLPLCFRVKHYIFVQNVSNESDITVIYCHNLDGSLHVFLGLQMLYCGSNQGYIKVKWLIH